MSQDNPQVVTSDLSDNIVQPHRFVKETSTGVDVATAGTDKIAGVFNGDIANAAGDTIPVVRGGTVLIEASAAITKGAYVTATSGGKAVATTTEGDVVRGVAREATTNGNGDLIEIMLTYFHHKA